MSFALLKSVPLAQPFSCSGRKISTSLSRGRRVVSGANKGTTSPPTDKEDIGTLGTAAVVAGLISNPIMIWSEYTLATTGSGLPPGPGGALGAAEGLSYLVVLAIIGWSIATKVQTGKGLPEGPSGLLGAVEGVSYLSLLGGIVVFGLQIAKTGGLPGIFG